MLLKKVQCNQIRRKTCTGQLKSGKMCGCALPHVKGFWCGDDCLIDKHIIHTRCEEIRRVL